MHRSPEVFFSQASYIKTLVKILMTIHYCESYWDPISPAQLISITEEVVVTSFYDNSNCRSQNN